MSKGNATLNELMGSAGAKVSSGKKLTLDDLPKLLGERMPQLDHTPVGRLRLMTALESRFGKNYRTLPGISDLMKEFDGHIAFNVKLTQLKAIKPKGS